MRSTQRNGNGVIAPAPPSLQRSAPRRSVARVEARLCRLISNDESQRRGKIRRIIPKAGYCFSDTSPTCRLRFRVLAATPKTAVALPVIKVLAAHKNRLAQPPAHKMRSLVVGLSATSEDIHWGASAKREPAMNYKSLILQLVLGIALVAIAWPLIHEIVRDTIAFAFLALVVGGIVLGILEGLFDVLKCLILSSARLRRLLF
jgi:hypothetical protein